MEKEHVMTLSGERPSVTFALFAYNHEQYIRAAVEGAFAQTYQPLEIILSDDCSSDRSFEIMREMAACYCGPAALVLKRNERNLGLVGHVNALMARASGDLVVMAAGDDVSMPNRTEKLVRAWLEQGKTADGLHSAYFLLGGSRSELVMPQIKPTPESFLQHGTARCLGATAAWTRRLWSEWGPLPTDALVEDRILSFRAVLAGGITPVPQPLVTYRYCSDGAPTSPFTWMERMLWTWQRDLASYDCYVRDLGAWASRHPQNRRQADELATRFRRRKALLERDCALLMRPGTGLLAYCGLLVAGFTWYKPGVRSRTRLAALLLYRHWIKGENSSGKPNWRDHRALRPEPPVGTDCAATIPELHGINQPSATVVAPEQRRAPASTMPGGAERG